MGSRIYGPLISVADLAPHQDLLVEVFGMATAGTATLTSDETEATFGCDGPVELVALRTAEVESGAVLCRFSSTSPGAGEQVRTEETRIHRDALRVIDFYARDFGAALDHARQAGFAMHAKEANYETNEGGFREAHHAGPDGVVTAFLHGPADFFTDFAEVRDRIASEPVSISLPLSDAQPVVDWYAQVFGWGVVYEYDFVDPSFSELMGVEEELRVRSVTIGPARQQTYVNIVDYGLGPDSPVGGSLLGHSVAPRRGVLGLVCLTDDLDDVRARAGETASDIVAVELAPFGATRACVLTPPYASPHLVLERA